MTEAWSCNILRIRSDLEAIQTIQFEWTEEGKKHKNSQHVFPPLHSTYGVVYLISMFVSVSYSVYF